MRLLPLTTIGLAATVILAAQAPKLATDWPSHGHDAGARRYSPLRQITTENVSRLQVAWTYDTPAAVPPSPSRGGPAAENQENEQPAGAPARGAASDSGAPA